MTWARPCPNPIPEKSAWPAWMTAGELQSAHHQHHDRAEITHRFESIAVGKDGRVTVA